MPSFDIYAIGLVHISVCTDLHEPAAVEREANARRPTGLNYRWRVIDERFGTGEPNPTPCADRPGHRHFLLTC